MELFWSDRIEGGICLLGEDESAHCVRVLRHRAGDNICVIDGAGTMYECTLTDDSPKHAVAAIRDVHHNWGGHHYHLTMAVCPTKNIDRYEWFAEKAVEVGLDKICPVFGDHSERKVIKNERLRKIVLSAAKQSLKSKVPEIAEIVTVKDFITSTKETPALKLIAYCFEDETVPRRSIRDVLKEQVSNGCFTDSSEFIVLIGPEGDFSQDEARMALDAGYIPVHLGNSRLRTETAALSAVLAVYYEFL